MKPSTKTNTRTRTAALAIIATLAIMSMLPTASAQETVDLGTADPFAILAGSAVTNTGPSVINGNIGVHPGSSVTGFESATVNGEIHIADEVAEQAKVDLTAAYNDAAGRTPATSLATELGNQVLTPGVYDSESGTFGLTGALTLDAQGNQSAVWIFQMESTLITASDSSVVLINGAQACNVFWQVGSSATLGARTDFKGNIMANAAITMNDAATLEGRALARIEAVTLINNVITIAECAPEEEPPGEEGPGEEPPGEEGPGEEGPGEEGPGEEGPGEEGPGEEGPGEEGPGEQVPGDEPSSGCGTDLQAIANEDTSVKLTWNPVAGADQYRVYRAVGDGALVLHGEVDDTTFFDMETEADVTYRYEVRPVAAGVESEDCEVVEVTAIPFFPGLLAGALALVGGLAAYALSRRR